MKQLNNSTTQQLFSTAKIIILALVLGLGISYAQAVWTGPLASPPNCTAGNPGCDAPINVSATAQTKTGDFTAGGLTLSKYPSGGPNSFISPSGTGTKALHLTSGYAGFTDINNLWRWYVLENGDTYTKGTAIIAGNVGIGTTTPQAKLEILGDNTGVNGIHIKTVSSAADSAPVGIRFNNNLGDSVAGISGTHYVGVDYLGNFRIDRPVAVGPNYNDFSIHSTGKVGIGTTLPTQKLDVAGTIRATGFQLPTSAAAGKVLTATNNLGDATWQTPSGGSPAPAYSTQIYFYNSFATFCKMNTLTGNTNCVYNTGGYATGSWNTTVSPFSATTNGSYALLCAAGGGSTSFFVCCRLNNITGVMECKNRNSTQLSTPWVPMTSPL